EKQRSKGDLPAPGTPCFCTTNAPRSPAGCAPAKFPIASPPRATRTRLVSGSASAILIRWTSHVSGKAETIFTPDRFNPLYTILEFSTETDTAADCSTNTYNPLVIQK